MRDVEIKLDKPRRLRFTIQALQDLQRISGQPLGDFIDTMGRISIQHLVWTVWAGLREDWPKLKVDEVSPLVQKYLDDGGSLPDLLRQMNDVLLECGLFTEPKRDLNGDPPGPAEAPA